MTRIASVGLLGGVLLMVWAGAVGAPSDATLPVSASALAAIDQAAPAVANLNQEAARLRARLANPPQFPTPQRDPFTFGISKSVPAPPPPRVSASAPIPAAATERVATAVPNLPRLVAVLTDAADGGPIRRAVIAIGDDVQVATPGQMVAQYLVRSIGADTVELVEASTGVVTRITLR